MSTIKFYIRKDKTSPKGESPILRNMMLRSKKSCVASSLPAEPVCRR